MFRRLLVVTVAGAMLSGCQTQDVDQMSYTQQKAWGAGIVKACKDQGVPDAEMQACIDAESKRDAANRYYNRERSERARTALATGMAGMGRSMQQGAYVLRPVNCSSSLGGTFVGQPTRINTTCY